MRCCVDILKFLLFFVNLIALFAFLGLEAGTLYVLFKGEDTFIGEAIEPSLSTSNPTAIYFTIIIILLVLFAFFSFFTFLGCCGTAFKSGCMIGSFIVIEFVLLGGAVGAVIFLHYQYGANPVGEILDTELGRSISGYKEENVVIKGFWDWLLITAQCCGVGREGISVWKEAHLPDGYRVPQACCRLSYKDCMYEPEPETTNLVDCVPIVQPYVQIVFYGLPTLMLVSLLTACIVVYSFNRRERRKEERPYRTHSQYSIGAADEFQTTTYGASSPPSAPYENAPFNPQYELNNYRHVEEYTIGTVPPPGPSHTPLLHGEPPSYNEVIQYGHSEVIKYGREPRRSYTDRC